MKVWNSIPNYNLLLSNKLFFKNKYLILKCGF